MCEHLKFRTCQTEVFMQGVNMKGYNCHFLYRDKQIENCDSFHSGLAHMGTFKNHILKSIFKSPGYCGPGPCVCVCVCIVCTTM